MTQEKPKAQPIETRTGKQMDDNIDDLGRKPDGSKLDQPGVRKSSSKDSTKRSTETQHTEQEEQ